MVAWSFIEAIAGSSCVAKIAVSSAKAAVVVLSDVGKYVVGRVLGIQ
jgi:CDP-diglyceride synthetase